MLSCYLLQKVNCCLYYVIVSKFRKFSLQNENKRDCYKMGGDWRDENDSDFIMDSNGTWFGHDLVPLFDWLLAHWPLIRLNPVPQRAIVIGQLFQKVPLTGSNCSVFSLDFCIYIHKRFLALIFYLNQGFSSYHTHCAVDFLCRVLRSTSALDFFFGILENWTTLSLTVLYLWLQKYKSLIFLLFLDNDRHVRHRKLSKGWKNWRGYLWHSLQGKFWVSNRVLDRETVLKILKGYLQTW